MSHYPAELPAFSKDKMRDEMEREREGPEFCSVTYRQCPKNPSDVHNSSHATETGKFPFFVRLHI